jgi:hypothetical protein
MAIAASHVNVAIDPPGAEYLCAIARMRAVRRHAGALRAGGHGQA